jgi:outer membrane murein-binding lipoprotein Lpp
MKVYTAMVTRRSVAGCISKAKADSEAVSAGAFGERNS